MSRSLAVNFTITSLVTAAQVTAAFAPVPWLSPAVGVLVGIVEICQKIETNRRNVQVLGQRCVFLVQGLCDFGEKSGVTAAVVLPGPVAKALADCVSILSGILDSMRAWSQLGLGKRLLMQDVVVEDIKRCNVRIDDCCNLFMMKTQIETSNWQATFEQQTREDHEETQLYLTEIQNNQALMKDAQMAQAQDNMKMMAMMQALLTKFEIGDHRHIGLQSNLYNVQRESRQLLPNLDLRAGEVRRIGSYPVGGSPAFDIWEGKYLDTEKCAIKVIRGINNSPNAHRRFKREVEIWRSIWEQDQGKYILPFWGVCQTDGPYPYMVSPWMSQGDVSTYLKRYPYADRMAIIRRIAQAIKILHSQTPPIAHGDLKAINVLINDHHEALLADFGLSKVLEDITGVPFTQSRGVSDSYRWFAPELCCAPGVITLGSDIFAFGMTILEILTGEQPFATVKRTTEVLIKMQEGDRPERPNDPEVLARGLDDNLWRLLHDCWAHDALKRPPIEEVIARLG